MPGETTRRLHPLLAAASVAVIVFAGVGVAALTGVLPISRGAPAPTESASAQPANGVAPGTKPGTTARDTAAAAPVAARRTERRTVAYARAPERAARREPMRLAAAKPRCLSCGVVAGVRVVEVKGKGTGLGAVAGGVAGALLGNQMGNGNGRTVMTLVGAAGGAFAGNAVEKKVRSTKHWDVDVRLADGRSQVIAYKAQPPWHAGDHVRVVNGTLQPD